MESLCFLFASCDRRECTRYSTVHWLHVRQSFFLCGYAQSRLLVSSSSDSSRVMRRACPEVLFLTVTPQEGFVDRSGPRAGSSGPRLEGLCQGVGHPVLLCARGDWCVIWREEGGDCVEGAAIRRGTPGHPSEGKAVRRHTSSATRRRRAGRRTVERRLRNRAQRTPSRPPPAREREHTRSPPFRLLGCRA